MSVVFGISAFLGLAVTIALLLFLAVLKRKRKTGSLYADALRAESNGNYATAIQLYQQYLQHCEEKKSPDAQEIDRVRLRIKTMQSQLAYEGQFHLRKES